MRATVVDSGSRLRVCYTLSRAANPQSDTVVVLHHGICHLREQFAELMAALNRLGIHVAVIDQQSEDAGFFVRNLIGLQSYVTGMEAALTAICEREHVQVGSYALHSMGALVGELLQQHHPERRRPTVLLAPIPPHGALPITGRLLLRYPCSYFVAVLTLNIRWLARSPKRVRQLFFDKGTPPNLVDRTTGQLKHAPFRVYCQLALRRWLRGLQVRDNGEPKLLLHSETDYIFRPSEYQNTIESYPSLRRELTPGGHDFFVQYAEQTAKLIAAFHHEHGWKPKAEGPPIPTPHVDFQPGGLPTAVQPVTGRIGSR